jgi:NADPH:quinone reductase-like Zn-dependent oxidoreductase
MTTRPPSPSTPSAPPVALASLAAVPHGTEGSQSISIGQHTVACKLLRENQPELEGEGADAERVLVRTRAFSCNYRDRGLFAVLDQHLTPGLCLGFGSELVGEVVAVGARVPHLRPRDRVIADNAYPGAAGPGVPLGMPTNMASQRFHVLHHAKLFAIDDRMPDVEAAAFSLGAQTAFAMIRKLALRAGERLLVTAGSSNTALFALAALRGSGVAVDVLTTSPAHRARLYELGAAEVLLAERGAPEVALRRAAGDRPRWSAVFDPFSDVYLPRVVPFLALDGRYVTCGVSGAVATVAPASNLWLADVIVKRLTIMGNCLGETADLSAAWAAYCRGELPVAIDSVWRGDAFDRFLTRSFDAPDRFGKVVYAYE